MTVPHLSPESGSNKRGAPSAPREAAAPWSITLPVAAGVFLGALVLSLLILAYLRAQTGTPKPAQAQAKPAAEQRHGSSAQPSAKVASRDETVVLPKLPGLIEANRLQLKTACIAGTVGHRRSNGWVQAVAKNAPRRCIATSQ